MLAERKPDSAENALKRVPLHDLHVARGGKIVPFAGYEMPVQYTAGVLKEHLHTRTSAGLFDVSHMGQITLTAKSGKVEDAARALERLVPQDILAVPQGRQRYAQFTNETGGILDDLMVANFGDHLFLVVLSKHAPTVAAMRFMDAGPHKVQISGQAIDCFVSRSGYTGEDGFEISVPAKDAERLATALLADPAVLPIGLGARDSLRLEAGLCLYGHDIDTTTTPVEGALEWSVQKSRRPGGARAGGFPGADIILKQFDTGASRRRVGLRAEGRAPVREGAALYASETSPEKIGTVTSGGFGPTLNAPVAMGYLPTALSTEGTTVFADVRGQRLPLRVSAMPFVPNGYKRQSQH